MKRRIILIILIALAILAAFLAWDYLRKGRITVSTNEKTNSIRINKLIDGEKVDDGLLFEEAGGEISARVIPGTYEISVFNKAVAKTKTVEIRSRQTVSEKIELVSPTSPEPVASIPGRSVSILNSELFYLNTAGEMLARLKENGESSFVGAEKLESIKWASTGAGLGGGKDGGLYFLSNGSIQPVAAPAGLDQKSIIDYDLTPEGKIYLASNADIYTGSSAGIDSKIYTTGVTAPRVVASERRIALISLPTPDGHGEHENEEVEHFVEFIDNNGKRIAKQGIEAEGGVWSPNGSRFATFNRVGKGAIYDESLNEIVVLPGDKVGAVVWLNNESVLYASGNTISRFDLQDKQATTLANLSANSLISELLISNDASYVYVVAGGFENEQRVSRVGLKGQQPPDYLKTLDLIFPEDLDPCFPNYVNITTPVIVIRHPSIIPASTCLDETKQYMQEFELDINKFRFRPEAFGDV